MYAREIFSHGFTGLAVTTNDFGTVYFRCGTLFCSTVALRIARLDALVYWFIC